MDTIFTDAAWPTVQNDNKIMPNLGIYFHGSMLGHATANFQNPRKFCPMTISCYIIILYGNLQCMPVVHAHTIRIAILILHLPVQE